LQEALFAIHRDAYPSYKLRRFKGVTLKMEAMLL
jgi:hypothetical protein